MKSVVYNGFTEWVGDAWNWIKDFFNQPIPIIGVSILFVTLFVLKIVATTTIGKRGLRKLEKSFNDFVSETNSLLRHNEKQEEEFKKDVHKAIGFYEDKNEIEKKEMFIKIAKLEALVLKISEENHNRNVKKLIAEYKEGKEYGEEQNG